MVGDREKKREEMVGDGNCNDGRSKKKREEMVGDGSKLYSIKKKEEMWAMDRNFILSQVVVRCLGFKV